MQELHLHQNTGRDVMGPPLEYPSTKVELRMADQGLGQGGERFWKGLRCPPIPLGVAYSHSLHTWKTQVEGTKAVDGDINP